MQIKLLQWPTLLEGNHGELFNFHSWNLPIWVLAGCLLLELFLCLRLSLLIPEL